MRWAERAKSDLDLRTFVEAEIARSHVELKSLRVEVEHWKSVAEALQRELNEGKKASKRG